MVMAKWIFMFAIQECCPALKRTNEFFINEGNDAPAYHILVNRLQNMAWQIQASAHRLIFLIMTGMAILICFCCITIPRNLPVLKSDATALLFKQPDAAIGLKLYRNDKNHFTDVTAQQTLTAAH